MRTEEEKKAYNRAYYREHKSHLREIAYYYNHQRDDSVEEVKRVREYKMRINENARLRYSTDPAYREKAKERARNSYYRRKQKKEEKND